MTQRKSKQANTIGWYVEVPAELYEAFSERFPYKGAKKALTVAAIQHALDVLIPDPGRMYENDIVQARRRVLEEHGADSSGNDIPSEEYRILLQGLEALGWRRGSEEDSTKDGGSC